MSEGIFCVYILAYIACIHHMMPCPSQVAFINKKYRTAGLPSYGKPGKAPVSDPSDALIEVRLAALKWNMQQRRFGLVAVDCARQGAHASQGGS